MKTYEPSEKDKKQIENNFKYHSPKEGQPEKYEIRAQACPWRLRNSKRL